MKSGVLVPLTGLVAGIVAGSDVVAATDRQFMAPWLVCIVALLLLVPAALVMIRVRQARVWLPVFLLTFVAGVVSIRTGRFMPPQPSRGQVTLTARVVEYKPVSERLSQLIVKPVSVRWDTIRRPVRGKLLIVMKPDPTRVYRRGDWWLFAPVRIDPVSDQPSGNGFVPSRYWRSKGIRHQVWLYPGQSRLLQESTRFSVLDQCGRWQSQLVSSIERMSLSAETSGLLKAMIFGDRSGISEDTRDVFSRAGIIHVISVSGLHVGIIYLLAGYLLSLIGFLPGRIRCVLALMLVWIYAGITGLSPSACRAAGMVSLFGVARLTGRKGTGLDILAGVALIHCLVDPCTVFSAGAQLSYLAVAGIFLWMPVMNRIFPEKRFTRRIAEAVGVSLAAQSLIVPVLVFWFGWFPLYFLCGNLILVPLLVFGFYTGILLVGLQGIGCCPGFLCRGMDLLVTGVLKAADWFGSLPGNRVHPEGMGLPELLVYYAFFLSVWYYLHNPRPGIWKRFLSGTTLLILIGVMRMLIA